MMEDLSYKKIKDRLDRLHGFMDKLDTLLPPDDTESPREDLKFLQSVFEFASAGGEKVQNENTRSFVDNEIDQFSPGPDSLSCVPVFIIGNRRSGTTLLSAMLDSHTRFCSIPENFMAENLSTSQDLATLSEKAFHKLRVPPDVFWGYQAHMIDDLYQGFIKSVGRGNRRWVSKEFFAPAQLDKLDYIFNYKPHYVYLVRHGLDVSYSCARRFPDRGQFNYQGNYLKGYLEEWIRNNELTMDFYERHKERCYLLKYEDLVAQPETELRKLIAFLGEEYEPELLDRMKTHDHPGADGDHSIYSTGYEVQSRKGEAWKNWPEPLRKQLFQMACSILMRLNYQIDSK